MLNCYWGYNYDNTTVYWTTCMHTQKIVVTPRINQVIKKQGCGDEKLTIVGSSYLCNICR